MLRIFWDEAVASGTERGPARRAAYAAVLAGRLTALWRTQGLQNVDEKPLTIDTVFVSFDDYWQPFLAGQGPAGRYAASLDESAREALKSALHRRLTDAGLTLRARAWAVRGSVI